MERALESGISDGVVRTEVGDDAVEHNGLALREVARLCGVGSETDWLDFLWNCGILIVTYDIDITQVC